MTGAPSRPVRPGSESPAAIAFTLLAGLLYVVGYTLSKIVVTRHGLSPLQLTFLRCLVVLACGMVAAVGPGSLVTVGRLLRPGKPWLQRAAAAALVVSNAVAVVAYTLMPVTVASALGFTAPLILALLGGVFLRERVTPGRWLGAAVGFVGMLLIVKPGGGASVPGIVAAFGGAVFYAVYQVLIRRLRDVATTIDTLLQVALVGVVLLGPAMAVEWRPVDGAALAMVVLVTAVQTAALASIAAALRRGEASRIAPWQFSGLLWAMGLDAVLFQAPPTAFSLLGGVLVIGGGVLAQTLGRPARP